jgi:hypothetical protein
MCGLSARADGRASLRDMPRIEHIARRTGDDYYESVVLDPEGNRIEIIA